MDSDTGDAAGLRVEGEAVDDAVGTNREAPGLFRCRKGGIEAAEIGLRDATALAFAAVMASGASFVRLREDGAAANGADAIAVIFRESRAEIQFDAGHFHGRQKFAVGKLRKALGLAADAGEFFDVIVPGSEIGVTNGPIDSYVFAKIGFEVEVAPTVGLAAPGDGSAADLAAANPCEGLAGSDSVGILQVVNEEFVRKLVAVVVALTLDELRALSFSAIVPATILQFPKGNVLDVILFRNDGAAGFQNKDVESLFGEFFGGPATSDTGTNDERVVGVCCHVG